MKYKDITEDRLNIMSIDCVLSLFKRAKSNKIEIAGDQTLEIRDDDGYRWLLLKGPDYMVRYAVKMDGDLSRQLFRHEVDYVLL